MGTGGMRIGAGRPACYVKAEHCQRLDIRVWNRRGLLQPGTSGTWRWIESYSGEARGTIGFQVREDHVHLDYSVGGTPSGQNVAITRTSCNYGGTRPWFVCPVRGERVAVLYMRAGRFACRHCQQVAYASQSEDALDRAWRKQRKVEAKLGKDWRKPKGMHWATHDRLRSIFWECEERRDRALAVYVGAFVRRHPSLARDFPI